MKSFNMYALSKHAAEQHHGLSHKFAAWVQVGGNRFYYMASSVSLSCPLGRTRRVLQEKFSRKPYEKSFIDPAWSVKMTGFWPRSFFWVHGTWLRLGP